MIGLFDVLILILCLSGVKVCKKGFWGDYIDREQCNAVKGISIIYIFSSHILGYVVKDGYSLAGFGDMLHLTINKLIGQLCVVMFLFYSGFGVAQSIERKGSQYIDLMPRRRVLTTMLNFSVAVAIFALANLVIGVKMTCLQFLLSIIGWDSIGNSNWYIFVIIFCYLTSWVAARNRLCTKVSLLIYGALLVSLSFTRPSYWYNTILSFPAGVLYSHYKTRVEDFCKRHYFGPLCALLAAFVVFRVYLIGVGIDPMGLIHNLLGIVFAVLIVLLSMKIKITNMCLIWFGVNVFPIYIYQRLPMRVLSKVLGSGFISHHVLVYMLSCFGLTLVIAYLYKYWRISDVMLEKIAACICCRK